MSVDRASTLVLAVSLAAGCFSASAANTEPAAHVDRHALRLGEAARVVDGDPGEARRILNPLLGEYRLLDDFVLYFSALASMADDPTRAQAHLRTLLAEHPESVLATTAAAKLVESLEGSFEPGEVVELAKKYEDGEPATDAARLLLAAGTRIAKRDARQGLTFLDGARRRAESTELAREAGDLARRIRIQQPELQPSNPDELYEEASLLGREGKPEEQAEILARLIEEHPGHSKYLRAVLARGRAISRTEGKGEAAAWTAKQAEKTKASRIKARLLYESANYDWNRHYNTQALAKFERVLAMATGISEEQRARYAVGRIHESARRYTAAASAYRRAARGSDHKLAKESKWRAGWASYLAGNYSGAAHVFGRMAKEAGPPVKPAGKPKSTTPTGREEALYWQARSLDRAGEAGKASEVYKLLLSEFPDGFYALLVESRKGIDAARPTVKLIDGEPSRLSDGLRLALARADALDTAGLDEYAFTELGRGLKEADSGALRSVLPELERLGAYTHALRVALQLYRGGKLEEDELYPFLYPHAYADVVKREAAKHSLDPMMVYALMRQESVFYSHAVSPASACGLMQLLPSTAKRMNVSNTERVENCEDLFNPETNIRLGVAYLALLAKLFEDDPVLMLAGYNAGEKAAGRWRERNGKLDQDEFIEQISYRETRNYVKKVMRNMRNYRRLSEAARGGLSAERGDKTAR